MLELQKDRSYEWLVYFARRRGLVGAGGVVLRRFRHKFVDILPAVFQDPDKGQVFVSWTSGRTGVRGDILARSITSPSSHVFQLTRSESSDYSAKIVPTRQSGEYLMVWVSTREGKPDIFARRFRL